MRLSQIKFFIAVSCALWLISSASAQSRVATEVKFGTIQVISQYEGRVYIDGADKGEISAGVAVDFFPVKVGLHSVKVAGVHNTFTQQAYVRQNKVVQLVFRAASLPDVASKTPDLTGTRTQVFLRSSPINNLSDADVKVMLTKHDFYCAHTKWTKEFKNPKGRGHKDKFQSQKNRRVVYDAATGLTWQQSGSENRLTFAEAKSYIQKINSEKYAGFEDWRLPTLEEAMSLMEPEKKKCRFVRRSFL